MANCSEPGEYSTACLPPRGFFVIVSNKEGPKGIIFFFCGF